MSIELMTLFPFLNYPTNLSIIPTTIEPSKFLLDHADKTHWKNLVLAAINVYTPDFVLQVREAFLRN